MKILIAGGGIGGLTAALCCAHHGHDVTVFEQVSKFGEVGSGVQISPNAMKVFEALGLQDKIAETAFMPESIEARMGKSGRHIFSIPLAKQAIEKWGSPYLHIHRADYIEALKNSLNARAPRALKLGATVIGYEQDKDNVTIRLQDGRMFSGDVLIGADGIRSGVREQMLGPDKPVFTGNVAWRAVVPMEVLGRHAPNPTSCAWFGQGRHGVTYRLRRGTLANFVGVVERDDWAREGWSELGNREEALRDFQGWHPVITHIIQAVEPGSLYRWALFDRAPLTRWTDGRVALLGDAAHPMLPFLAQGAAMAVEDGWVLAAEISKPNQSLPQSLKAYQARRFVRSSKVQAESRANMKTFHQNTRMGQIMTYGPMWLASRLLPSVVHKRMDWLYRHDVTSY